MTDQASWPTDQRLHRTAPPAHQAVKFLTAASIGSTLVVLSGLTLTGTVMALILATPLLVLFSPILVPAGIVVVLATVGFGVAALTALSWIYKYAAGEHPAGADQLDYARMKIASKVKEYGQYVQHMAHDATHHNEGPHRQHQGYAYSS